MTLASGSPALDEGDPFSLAALLDLGADEILASIAGGVNPRARVHHNDGGPGVRASWHIAIDAETDPTHQPKSVEIVRFSTGPQTVFIRRRPLRH